MSCVIMIRKMRKMKRVFLILSLFSVVLLFYIYMPFIGYISYSKCANICSMNIGQNSFVKRIFNYSSDMLNENKRCFRLLWDFPKNGSRLDNLITDRCKRVVTIGRSRGRTGNDMFQIAAIFGFAYRYDLIPIVPLSFPLLKYFDLPNVVNIRSETLYNGITCRSEVAIYTNFNIAYNLESNFTLDGNFQSWRYFERENNIIRRILRLKSKHVMNAKKYIREVNPHGHTQVCIHIRRGDFNLLGNLKIGYTVVDEHYVEKAKQVFMQNNSNVFFLVVTDDQEWCKKNLNNVTISPFINPGDDMALMSLSDHVIMTSGTFGWWGAWLSGGEVVYFKGFPRPKSKLAKVFNRFDYYPERWMGIT